MGRLSATVGSLAIALITGEVAVRVLAPRPRSQVIREGAVELYEASDGGPSWRSVQHNPEPDCQPGDRRVLLLGSSILYGSGLGRREDVVSARLEALVDGICVDNRAEPAFGMREKIAVGERALAEARPDLVYVEVWQNDDAAHRRVGDSIYDTRGFDADPNGIPRFSSVPEGLAPLLLRSRLYEYAVLALAPEPPGDIARRWDERVVAPLGVFAARLRDQGVPVVLLEMPPLDRPFRESVARPFISYARLYPLERDGLPVVDVAAWLVDERPEELRVDACCHYAAAGHQRLAEHLALDIASRLDR